MDLQNTSLDDIAAEIGFSATLRLVAWFAEKGLCYVPVEATEDRLLTKLIGLPAARRLSARWPGENLVIPSLADYGVMERHSAIAKMVSAGMRPREIARILRMSRRRVEQVCREMSQLGILELMVAEKSDPRGRE